MWLTVDKTHSQIGSYHFYAKRHGCDKMADKPTVLAQKSGAPYRKLRIMNSINLYLTIQTYAPFVYKSSPSAVDLH